MKKQKLRRATEAWLAHFDEVPASVIEKMAQADPTMLDYDSPSLRILANPDPGILCDRCLYPYEGGKTLDELKELLDTARREACENCGYDVAWTTNLPSTFPCGWSTLFAPLAADRRWFIDNCVAVSNLGFYVFESEDYGVLLGIDAAGFDFYEAYWIPLYDLYRNR